MEKLFPTILSLKRTEKINEFRCNKLFLFLGNICRMALSDRLEGKLISQVEMVLGCFRSESFERYWYKIGIGTLFFDRLV